MPEKHGGTDHVGWIMQRRQIESPGVPLDGLAILGRARRLTLLSREKIEAVFARHGIDTGEFDVLATLRREGAPYSLRPTEIFRSLMISSGGLTDRLKRLEKRGLIAREAAPEDGRSMLVKLTDQGKDLIDTAFREDMEVEQGMVDVLPAKERQQLAMLLEKLLITLEAKSE